MIRVFGDMPIGIDVDLQAKMVTFHRTDLPRNPEIVRLSVDDTWAMRMRQRQAEEWLEWGFSVPLLPDQEPIANLVVELEREAGHIVWVRSDMASRPALVRVSAVQSENLRRVMERAEVLIRTGVGDMLTP